MGDPDGACHGKHAFANRRDAGAAVRNHHRRGRKAIHAYRCHVCGDWHVGAKKPRPPKPPQTRGGWGA